MNHGLATKSCINANGEVDEMFPRPASMDEAGCGRIAASAIGAASSPSPLSRRIAAHERRESVQERRTLASKLVTVCKAQAAQDALAAYGDAERRFAPVGQARAPLEQAT
jgi:hypothetical protein